MMEVVPGPWQLFWSSGSQRWACEPPVQKNYADNGSKDLVLASMKEDFKSSGTSLEATETIKP